MFSKVRRSVNIRTASTSHRTPGTMKSVTYVAMLLASVCPTLAFPAANQVLHYEEADCCCCDISPGLVSCANSTDAMQCASLVVACPNGAPTNWEEEIPTSEPTVELSAPLEEVQCCCCVMSQPTILCRKQPADEGYICPFVPRPPDAATVYPEFKPMPTPTAARDPFHPTPPPPTLFEHDITGDDLVPCCCCDISKPAVSCKMQAESEGCICAMVVCPIDAPTVWPEGAPAPTASALPLSSNWITSSSDNPTAEGGAKSFFGRPF